MNFLKLYYFVVAAEEKNITKAAERLFISQQSLSNHIQKLEKEFGVSLFDRIPSLTLTYAGTQFLSYAKKILDLNERWQAELDEIKKQKRGKVVIGISHDRGKLFLPQILPAYSKENPLVDISLVEGGFRVLQKSLLQGSIDLYIGIAPIALDDMNVVEVRQERVFIGVSEEFLAQKTSGRVQEFLQKNGQGVDISFFEDTPFLLPPPGNRARTLFEQVVKKHDINLNIVMEIESTETMHSLASQNVGMMVCAEAFIGSLPQAVSSCASRVHFLPLADPEATGTLIIAHAQNRHISSAAQKFIDMVTSLFSSSII